MTFFSTHPGTWLPWVSGEERDDALPVAEKSSPWMPQIIGLGITQGQGRFGLICLNDICRPTGGNQKWLWLSIDIKLPLCQVVKACKGRSFSCKWSCGRLTDPWDGYRCLEGPGYLLSETVWEPEDVNDGLEGCVMNTSSLRKEIRKSFGFMPSRW